MDEMKKLLDIYRSLGWRPMFLDRNVSSLVVSKNKTINISESEGIRIETREIKDGVRVKIFVKPNVNVKNPVHLCFTMPHAGKQRIISEFYVGNGAKVKFISHCIFPKNVSHIMNSKVYLRKNAFMEYVEEHYHAGEASVYPKLRAILDKGSKLLEEFKVVKERAGTIKIDYKIRQKENSVSNLLTKIFGKKNDRIEIKDSLFLDGAYAKGVVKTRMVLADNAIGKVLGKIEGNAPYSRGHIDCEEIIKGNNVKAESIPQIKVTNPLAKITHEAAIGRIDKKKLETLMARGLTEEEALNMIVRGILK